MGKGKAVLSVPSGLIICLASEPVRRTYDWGRAVTDTKYTKSRRIEGPCEAERLLAHQGLPGNASEDFSPRSK